VLSRRTLLFILAHAPLAACNTLGADSLKVAARDDQFSSFVDPSSREQSEAPASDRSKLGTDLPREIVPYKGGERPGTIVIKTTERRLYLVVDDGKAIRYPVGVGAAGKQWSGTAYIESKHVRPAWSPPEEIRRDNPRLPDVIPGGAPNNPMGERALVLQDEYAIHGTNRPHTVGTFATYGCIRMFNEDIVDLFDRVSVGTEVVVRA
jgi:lipoprotein-anchoring transpeptidase ErfK/SrfK